jgi:hypothetical protein
MFQLNPTHEGLTKFQHSPTPFIAPDHHSKAFLNPNAPPKLLESISRQRLGEDVRDLLGRRHVLQSNLFCLEDLANPVLLDVDMLGFIVELGIFGQIQRALVSVRMSTLSGSEQL